MNKLKLISAGMMILGIISFIGGTVIRMNVLIEYGLYIGIAGIMGYAIMFIMDSASKTVQKPNYD